jgi:hypothetical protein
MFGVVACKKDETEAYNSVREYINKNKFFNLCILEDGLIAACDSESGEISLQRKDKATDIFIEITISEKDSSFSWQAKVDNYTMEGVEKKRKISSDTRSLSYNLTNAPARLTETINESCALALVLLLYSANSSFKEINVDVADLGFTNFK